MYIYIYIIVDRLLPRAGLGLDRDLHGLPEGDDRPVLHGLLLVIGGVLSSTAMLDILFRAYIYIYIYIYIYAYIIHTLYICIYIYIYTAIVIIPGIVISSIVICALHGLGSFSRGHALVASKCIIVCIIVCMIVYWYSIV